MPAFRPLSERFWGKVAIAGPDECWLWTASRYTDGYGKIRANERRASMSAAHVDEIRALYATGLWSMSQLGKRYGVEPHAIWYRIHQIHKDSTKQDNIMPLLHYP